jgi:hypothetical protein
MPLLRVFDTVNHTFSMCSTFVSLALVMENFSSLRNGVRRSDCQTNLSFHPQPRSTHALIIQQTVSHSRLTHVEAQGNAPCARATDTSAAQTPLHLRSTDFPTPPQHKPPYSKPKNTRATFRCRS